MDNIFFRGGVHAMMSAACCGDFPVHTHTHTHTSAHVCVRARSRGGGEGGEEGVSLLARVPECV